MATTSYQTFKVPSSGQPGVSYEVRQFADGVWTCSCPHFTYRRVADCKHIRLALLMWTTPGRSGALVARHEAQQVKAETGLSHTMAPAVISDEAGERSSCVCGYVTDYHQTRGASIRALAEHVGAARKGERAQERAERYAAETDLREVYRITRSI